MTSSANIVPLFKQFKNFGVVKESMSSSDTDEEIDFDYEDFDVDDSSENLGYSPYSSDGDTPFNDLDSDDDEIFTFKPSQAKPNAFVWKDYLKQRFTEFFQGEFSAEAIVSVEAFVKHYNLNDALVDDLLELVMLLLGRTICSNCNHSSCQTVVSNEASQSPTSKKAVPDSTVTDGSIKSDNLCIQHTSVALTPKVTFQKEVVESNNERPESSAKFVVDNKRKSEYSVEPPSKKMAFEAVMEKRENGHLFCKVCKSQCTSEKNAKDHFIGKSHNKNVERAKVTANQQKKESCATKTDAGQSTSNRQCADDNIGTIYCDVCEVHISGKDNANAHFAGTKHWKKQKNQKTDIFTLRKKISTRVSDVSVNNRSASISQVLAPKNVSEVKSKNSAIVSETPSSPPLLPLDIEEIPCDINVTKKLRVFYKEGQREVDNESDSDIE